MTTRTRRAAPGPLTSVDITTLGASVWAELMGFPDTPPVGGDRGYWRPSKLGRCMAHQFLWRAGVPASRVETESQRVAKEQRFDIGNRIEDQTRDRIWTAGLLIARGWTMQDVELQVRGNIDIIWGGSLARPSHQERAWNDDLRAAVYELRRRVQMAIDKRGRVPITHTEVKSTGSWTIGQMRGEPTRMDYRCQAGCYRLLASMHPDQLPGGPIERHEVLVIARDGGQPLLLEITEADAALARDRLLELNERWESQDMPACTCGQTPGITWEAGLCDYLGLDGEVCCRQSDQLANVLAASVAATTKPVRPVLADGRPAVGVLDQPQKPVQPALTDGGST